MQHSSTQYSVMTFTGKESKAASGSSLVVRWLGLCTANAGSSGLFPNQGTRSHMPQLGVCTLQLKIPHAAVKMKDLCPATKTQHSQEISIKKELVYV